MNFSFFEEYQKRRDELCDEFRESLSQEPITDGTPKHAEKLLDGLVYALESKDTDILARAIEESVYKPEASSNHATLANLFHILHAFKFRLAGLGKDSGESDAFIEDLSTIDGLICMTQKQLLAKVEILQTNQIQNQIDSIKQEAILKSRRLDRMRALVKTLLSNSGDYFIIQMDRDDSIRHFSPSAQKLLGYAQSDVFGKALETIHPEWFVEEGHARDLHSRLDRSDNWEGEVVFIHKNGQEIHAHLSLSRIRTSHGVLIGTVAIGRDISEQRSLQEQLFKYNVDLQKMVEERSKELEESEERYRRLIEDINEGYFITLSEKLIFTNKAFANITGHSRAELKGKRFLDLVYLRSEQGAIKWWKKIEQGYMQRSVELLMKRKDGKKAVVECKAQPLVLRGVPHIIGVLHDITENKKMEHKLRQYVENLESIVNERTKELEHSLQELKSTQFQLIQSEKLAGIGILAAGVAHEINNPLQALMLKSQYIIKHIDNKMTVKKSARDMIRYVNRMAEIVRGLSKHAQTIKRDDDFAAVDLVEIIKESLELAYHTRNFGDVIVKREFDYVAPVVGNKGQYQQIFINLIINAIDAMDSKGKLTLRLKEYSDRMVLAEVEDTGCGIPDNNLDKIFAPLFTTKPTGKGTGLGLHVSYRIISQYGGEIKVDSDGKNGTKFSLFFPIMEVNGDPRLDKKESDA